jgi:hypothetical protein
MASADPTDARSTWGFDSREPRETGTNAGWDRTERTLGRSAADRNGANESPLIPALLHPRRRPFDG